MARKKKTTVTEEEIVEETPKDEIDYTKDIRDKDINQIATETPKEEEEKVEETPVETPKEEETEEIEFDPQQLKNEAIEEAEKRLLDKLKGTTGDETKENIDEYQQWAEQFAQSHGGKVPEWKDAFGWMEERAVTKLEERQTAKQAEETAKQDEAKKVLEAEQVRVDTYVDKQLDDLYTSKKLPRIKNAEDPNDIGTVYRKSLFDQTIKINKERIDKGFSPKTIKEVFYEDFKKPGQDVAGWNAPVATGRGSTAGDDQEEINYVRDVHNKRSYLDILMGRK